jgi:hypothetical protein
VLFAKNIQYDNKEDLMSTECSKNGVMGIASGFLYESLKERAHYEEQDVCGWII